MSFADELLHMLRGANVETTPHSFDISVPGGQMRGRLQGDQVAKIDSSFVEPERQGRGLGMEMYNKAAELADKQGRHLFSDRSVTPAAGNAYQGLANRGRTVYKSSSIDAPLAGEFQHNDMGGPVYAVPNPELGDLKEALVAYMGQEVDDKFLEAFAGTYYKLQARNPETSNDPQSAQDLFKAAVEITLATLGVAGATAVAGDGGMLNEVGG